MCGEPKMREILCYNYQTVAALWLHQRNMLVKKTTST